MISLMWHCHWGRWTGFLSPSCLRHVPNAGCVGAGSGIKGGREGAWWEEPCYILSVCCLWTVHLPVSSLLHCVRMAPLGGCNNKRKTLLPVSRMVLCLCFLSLCVCLLSIVSVSWTGGCVHFYLTRRTAALKQLQRGIVSVGTRAWCIAQILIENPTHSS